MTSLGVALLLLGCSSSDDGSTGGDDSAAAGSDVQTGGPANTGTAPATTDDGAQAGNGNAGGAAAPAGAGGSGAPTDGAGDGEREGTGSGAQAGGPAAGSCDESSPFSAPQLRDCDLPGFCGRCMWEKACANFLFHCARDADCVCMAECVGSAGVGGTDGCFTQCGLTQSPPGFAQWVKAASDMCWDEGCGTLGEPPPEPADATTGGNAGAGTDADCVFDDNLSHDPCGEVLQLQSEDGSLCARIERRNDGAGNDANVSWTLLDVRIGPLGQVCHTESPADLCWHSSHHNYADWLHIDCGELHYDLNIGKNCGELRNPDSTYTLHAFESAPGATDACAPTADGVCQVVPPVVLVPAR